MPKISIIIPTYQGRESLKRLLEALRKQTFPDTDFEVIVSIDGSDDGTREMVGEFESSYALQFIYQENSGRASACNKGIYEAKGEVLIILDDDMEPYPSFVQAHYESHKTSESQGIVGSAPIYVDQNSSPVTQFRAKAFNERYKTMSEPDYEFRIWDFYSGNFSIRRNVLIEAGAYNESFKLYGHEDIELAYRLIDAGVEILFNTDALCRQYNDDNLADLANKSVSSGKNVVLFTKMHPETLNQFELGSYYHAGWKWRTLRFVLVKSTMAVPAIHRTVLFFTDHLSFLGPDIRNKIYFLVLDYSFWLGVWSCAHREENRDIISKIKSTTKNN